jgi:GT2 family glycosyltransferase
VSTPRPDLQIQAVLFHTEPSALSRTLSALDQAIRLAQASGALGATAVVLGDGSPSPVVDEELLAEWSQRFTAIESIRYDFFSENLGSAAGHNRLAAASESQLIVTSNPDVVAAPRSLEIMARELADPSVALVEAKQIPLEHPKAFDPISGTTSWASTAFAMFRRSAFEEVGGFDAETFFLYCDDVDFSWQVRLAGHKLIFQPAATVFHDKRLSLEGSWQPSGAELYYSAIAGLLLPFKWSREDLTYRYLEHFENHGGPDQLRAAKEYRQREAAGSLPNQVDPHHKIGEFVNGAYAEHRYSL